MKTTLPISSKSKQDKRQKMFHEWRLTSHHITGFPAFSAQRNQFITRRKQWHICASEPEYTVKQPSLQTHCGGKTTVRHEAKPQDEPAKSLVRLALSYSIGPTCLSLEVKHQSPISSPRLTRLIGSTLDTRTARERTGGVSLLSGEDLLSPNCQLFRNLEENGLFLSWETKGQNFLKLSGSTC